MSKLKTVSEAEFKSLMESPASSGQNTSCAASPARWMRPVILVGVSAVWVLAAWLLNGCASAQKRQLEALSAADQVLAQAQDQDCEKIKLAASFAYPEAAGVNCDTVEILLAGLRQVVQDQMKELSK